MKQYATLQGMRHVNVIKSYAFVNIYKDLNSVREICSLCDLHTIILAILISNCNLFIWKSHTDDLLCVLLATQKIYGCFPH